MPSLILYNGKIQTQDPDYLQASSVAIRGSRFLAVGADAEIRSLAGPHTRSIDLGGRCALPGLTDAHFHFHDWSLGLSRMSLSETRSKTELLQHLVQESHSTPLGQWIVGQGWNETRWPEATIPDRADLDSAVPDHPLLLWRNDMHLAIANTRALQIARIGQNTRNPPEGMIDRDREGQATGVLRDLAINLVSDLIPAPTEAEREAALQEGFGVLHRLGLTGVHDFRIMGGAEGAPALNAYQRLHSRGDLSLRTWVDLPGERLTEAIDLGLRSGLGNGILNIGHVKFFSDGGQGARTAWMLEPYEDTDHCGMPLSPMDEIGEAIHRAETAGLAVAVHAIGDRANRELITAFERTAQRRGKLPATPVLHRIEHVQMIQPEDIRRLAQLDVVASVQPLHITDDIPMIEKSVGARGRFAYPFLNLLRAGVPLAFGSDCPVADPNPFWGIHAAVTRQRRDGTPENGWYPEQKLSVGEALRAYTLGAAEVCGRADDLGSITPGKLADLIVVDRNLFELAQSSPASIADTQVLMTVFNGNIVYEQVGFNPGRS